MCVKVAAVTGSNRGIGLSIVKGLCKRFDGDVFLTSRDESRGRAAVDGLHKLGLKPLYHQLDVTDRNSVLKFREYIKKEYGGLDILINNAAVCNSFIKSNYDEDENIINVNYRSALIIQELIFPLIKDGGRILNISSDCGHVSNVRSAYWLGRLTDDSLTVDDLNEFVDWFLQSSKNGTFNKSDFADNGSIASYRVSKVALSALTKLQQKELEPRSISVNSVYPGLVRTRMTFQIGFLSADEAAETPIYLVLEAPQTLRGEYIWYDKKIIDWGDHKNEVYFKTSLARSWIIHSIFANARDYILSFFRS